MPSQPQVLEFIEQFKSSEQLFMYGMCYWFAAILHLRFPNSQVVYDPIANHFACKIESEIFDICGAVHNGNFHLWSDYCSLDPLHAARIKKYCILKEKE